MNPSSALLKEIHECFKDAADRQPSYREMLPFFENVFEMQEAAVPNTFPEGLNQIGSAQRSRNGAQGPLLDRRKISIDMASALRLLKTICAAAETAGSKLAGTAAALEDCLEKDEKLLERGLDCLKAGNIGAFEIFSDELGLDTTVFAFFLYHSIWPSLAKYVDHFRKNDAISAEGESRSCPVCGSSPNLAYLSENGKRHLVCGFCRCEWPAKRILCPHCGNDQADTLTYFYNEEENAYRVYTCDKCKQYVKTVDTRQLSRSFYPPLESLITLHLDLQAESMGYKRSEDSKLFGG